MDLISQHYQRKVELLVIFSGFSDFVSLLFQIFCLIGTDVNEMPNVPEIEWHKLNSLKEKEGNAVQDQLGEGVFGWCVKKYYKGIPVAVKVLNQLSSAQDVRNEAYTMAQCSHPSIPHLFGVNVTKKPYFIVSYFYHLHNSSCTLYHALQSKLMSLSQHSAENILLKLCEAIDYLHLKRFLHRDIKSDNIILTEVNNMYHPMLIDFGKAIRLSDAPSKQKSMTAQEQEEYRKRHRHIAPELVVGQPPSFASDMFSLGLVMKDVSGKVKMGSNFVAGQRKCLQPNPKLRCTISYLLSLLKTNH